MELADISRRAWNLGRFALERHILGRRHLDRRIHDYRLLLDADDPGISRQLARLGSREPEQKFIVERLLKRGMTAFDLGANIGYYTVMMAGLVGETGRVYAVEPHPWNFELLSVNVSRNGMDERVALQRVAIARATGRETLLLSAKSNWHSLHRPVVDMRSPWRHKYARTVVGEIDVEARSLDDYLADKPAIDLIRMDLEGYEVEILSSLAARCARGLPRPAVLFETHPEFYDTGGNDIWPVLEELCGVHGYEVRYLVSDDHDGSATTMFRRHGVGADRIVAQFRRRAIYSGIDWPAAIELIAAHEQVHAALLAPRASAA
jgi:FkbM family methyltransferase